MVNNMAEDWSHPHKKSTIYKVFSTSKLRQMCSVGTNKMFYVFNWLINTDYKKLFKNYLVFESEL